MSISYKAIVNGKYLCHMNTHHDPKNGRFTTAPGGVSTHNPSGWVGAKYDGNTKKQTNAKKSKSSLNWEKGLDKTSRALGQAGKNMQNLRLHGKKKGEKTDLSQYSDQELRRIIDRARMESDYDRLFNPSTESKGEKFVKGLGTGLTVASLVVGIVGGAAGAYSAFTGKPVSDLFKKKS